MATVNFRGITINNVEDIHTENGSIVIGETSFPYDKGVSIYVENGYAGCVYCLNAVTTEISANLYVDRTTTIYCVKDGIDSPEIWHMGNPVTGRAIDNMFDYLEQPDKYEDTNEITVDDIPNLLPLSTVKTKEVIKVEGNIESIQALDCEVFLRNAFAHKLFVKERLISYKDVEKFSVDIINIPRKMIVNNTRFFKLSRRGFEFACNDDYTGIRHENARIPEYATKHSAAADFFCAEDVTIPPAEIAGGKVIAKPTLVHTGIKAYMGNNEVLHLYNRSGNVKRGLVLANSVGVIDSDYYNNESNDGEIMFAFYNFSGKSIEIKAGERIGQGEFSDFYRADGAIVRDSERSGGFGSTGK